MAGARREPSLAEVRRTLRANRARLLALPNVVRLAIGGKVAGGERQPALAIRVHVRRKRRRARLSAGETIPTRLRVIGADGVPDCYVPTDVVKAEAPLRLLQLSGADRVLGGRTIPGMSALVYTSHSGRDFVLTNAHVAVGADFHPTQISGSTEIFRPSSSLAVAAVHRLTPVRTGGMVNRMDAALGWIYADQEVVRRCLRNQPHAVIGVEDVHRRSSHRYFFVGSDGARKHFAIPDEAEPELIDVGGRWARFRGFYTLRQVRNGGSPIEGGDSGSLLVREGSTGLLAAGLVFAGGGRTLAVYPVSAAFAALADARSSRSGSSEQVGIDFSR